MLEGIRVLDLSRVIKVERPGGRRPPVRRPAPSLGQHTREVFGELGISESDIDRLIGLGAIAE